MGRFILHQGHFQPLTVIYIKKVSQKMLGDSGHKEKDPSKVVVTLVPNLMRMHAGAELCWGRGVLAAAPQAPEF